MNTRISATIAALFLFGTVCFGHEDNASVQDGTNSSVPIIHLRVDGNGPTPWTRLVLGKNAGSFHFAIMSDRTGGHRNGVFEDAIGKLNLLQPDFVMSIGDLIEGYTNDARQVKSEWNEFDGFVKQLQMPFFYTAGNHDFSNPVMADVWREHLGRSYYDFRYNDVLFVVLNSNDGGAVHKMSEAQIQWLKTELAANTDVKWTLIFIHAPLWDRSDKDRWPEVEKLLEGRNFTAFAGHNHNYVKNHIGGHNYYTLATTGGASSLRGPNFGEFDHVVWVTMTDKGPIVTNLMLDGIWPDDLSTKGIHQYENSVLTGAFRFPPVLFKDTFGKGESVLRLTNDSDLPCTVHLTLRQTGPVIIDTLLPESVAMNPNDVIMFPITFHSGAVIDHDEQVAELSWSLDATVQDKPVHFEGKSPLVVIKERSIPELPNAVVDGNLTEWGKLPFFVGEDSQKEAGWGKWTGLKDASLQWGIARKGGDICIAVDVQDPERRADPKDTSWMQDNVQVIVDARPLSMRINNPAGFDYNYPHGVFAFNFIRREDDSLFIPGSSKLPKGTQTALVATADGYKLELSIPQAFLDKSAEGTWDGARVNVVLTDADPGEDGYTLLDWQPSWMAEGSWPGTGSFRR